METNFDQKAKDWDLQADRVERARVIAHKIQEAVSMGPDSDVLDFGCGTGLLGFHFAPHARSVTFADPSHAMLDQVAQKARHLGYSSCHTAILPWDASRSFDVVVSLMVLHHIEDHRTAIETLISQVRPRGFLCLSDLDLEDGSFHTDEVVPHQGFARTEMVSLLKAGGLEVVRVETGFVNRKRIQGKEREFPVFLIIGKKG